MAGTEKPEIYEVTVTEEEEMQLYKKQAVNVTTFRIVHSENDLETSARKSNSFKPEMAHQIFTDGEMIFGYKNLCIDLYYLHNSAKCFVDIKSSGKLPESDIAKPDDIMGTLNPWLPQDYRLKIEDFLPDIKAEVHDKIHGEVIETFSGERNRVYKITKCDLKNVEFQEFHQRFETIIIWFIDGANFIDLEDPKWMIFYVYEEFTDEGTRKMRRSPIGFCTVYNFYLYPNSVRPRISQFFVLPTHQRKGIATKMYSSIFHFLKELPEVGDVTVEEPTEVFQKIRDFCDGLLIHNYLKDHNINLSLQNQKQINQILREHKLCKRQGQRILDILQILKSHKNGVKGHLQYNETIKSRISKNIEKEKGGSKRICNSEREAMISEHIDKKAVIEGEFNNYIESLEWPINRLKKIVEENVEN